MRHVILVIVLVGAAFLGGAFVNGPGLHWVQTQVLGTLGFNDEVEIASVELKGPKDNQPGTASAKPPAAKPKRGEPSLNEPMAPAPTVVTENAVPAISENRPKRGGKSGRPEPVGIAPVMLEPAKPVVAASPKTSEKPPGETDPELLPPLSAAPPLAPPSDGNVTPTIDRGATDPGPAEPRSPGLDLGSKPALLDSLASFLPAPGSGQPSDASAAKDKSPATLPVAPSGDRELPGLPAPGASNGGGNEWTQLGRKMQSLGVTRFSVEGEPGGRVVFSCLIPLVGKQAVTQRFEADGDDLFQAVQATLRRIALWRATQLADRAALTP